MTCRLASIAPSPKEMLLALDALRRLDRVLNAAEDMAFTMQGGPDSNRPPATIAALKTAEEKLADAGRIIRGEIARLERMTRGVAFVPNGPHQGATRPHPFAAGALTSVDGGLA